MTQREGPSGTPAGFALVRSSLTLSAQAPTRVMVTSPGLQNPLGDPFRCRIIPAHTDVAQRQIAPNGCAVDLSIDSNTRLSRFALDPKMSIDVIVYEDRRRVGFLLTALTYAPGP